MKHRKVNEDHVHHWEVVGVKEDRPGSNHELVWTHALYRCSCGLHETRILTGEWSTGELI
jgi:hypothetical protein